MLIKLTVNKKHAYHKFLLCHITPTCFSSITMAFLIPVHVYTFRQKNIFIQKEVFRKSDCNTSQMTVKTRGQKLWSNAYN